jgi:hypothetical protein
MDFNIRQPKWLHILELPFGIANYLSFEINSLAPVNIGLLIADCLVQLSVDVSGRLPDLTWV